MWYNITYFLQLFLLLCDLYFAAVTQKSFLLFQFEKIVLWRLQYLSNLRVLVWLADSIRNIVESIGVAEIVGFNVEGLGSRFFLTRCTCKLMRKSKTAILVQLGHLKPVNSTTWAPIFSAKKLACTAPIFLSLSFLLRHSAEEVRRAFLIEEEEQNIG